MYEKACVISQGRGRVWWRAPCPFPPHTIITRPLTSQRAGDLALCRSAASFWDVKALCIFRRDLKRFWHKPLRHWSGSTLMPHVGRRDAGRELGLSASFLRKIIDISARFLCLQCPTTSTDTHAHPPLNIIRQALTTQKARRWPGTRQQELQPAEPLRRHVRPPSPSSSPSSSPSPRPTGKASSQACGRVRLLPLLRLKRLPLLLSTVPATMRATPARPIKWTAREMRWRPLPTPVPRPSPLQDAPTQQNNNWRRCRCIST